MDVMPRHAAPPAPTRSGAPDVTDAKAPRPPRKNPASYGGHDPKEPALSPIFADLKNFPPTLCVTGTRDLCLSPTTDFHRALLKAGVKTELVVFDAMPHAFWFQVTVPESIEAVQIMARFFDEHVGR